MLTPITMRSTLLNPVARILSISLLLNVITAIRTMFTSLSSAAMGIRLPIMMADDDDNYKDRFKYIIVAIVVLVVGAVTVSIVSGVGLYILNTFNTTAVKIPSSYNFVTPIAPTLGSIFQILVVVLIIVALIYVIRYLMKSTDMF
jgi:hypothetical protein